MNASTVECPECKGTTYCGDCEGYGCATCDETGICPECDGLGCYEPYDDGTEIPS